MNTKEIREAFLGYFEEKEHSVVASSPLIPAGDPTLLFTNAGMVQFKDCFLGSEKRSYVRATTCQKCLRISGKHNDLENVGRTARHHTFFEMLGNFSFGDYFKQEAITYAWKFITETLGLPKDRLWVTIYEDDDEAEELWRKNTDVFEGRIVRRDEKDNFWAMGDTGPCGPCSEIFYYLGDAVDSQSVDEFLLDDGTYVEIWNLVFMQFNRDAQGNLDPLPKPSVDTGMGLERVAAVMQGKTSNYDNDLFRDLISVSEKLSGKTYIGTDYSERDTNTDEQYASDVAMRVIADHARSSCFLIADGIAPSSDGRGYVLRRLIRRACRHGRVLGFREPFLTNICQEVISLMGGAYPELVKNQAEIIRSVEQEEKKFLVTLDTGMNLLSKEVERLKGESTRSLSGEVAFQLHDTYGFPLDLTEDIAKGFGLSVDVDGFSVEMEKQRERSRAARAGETELILQRSVKPIPSEFVGYSFNEYESKVTGLFTKDGEVDSAEAGEEIALVAECTPFYAESGGQVGDTGSISAANAALDVIDTLKVGSDTIVHICRVVEGVIAKGDQVRLEIDVSRRERIRVHHSATHLLHFALRQVLGDHVKQAGSRVSDRSLRFDFSHGEAVTRGQLDEIEDIVNQYIQENHEVITKVMPLEEAKRAGATALFGEKYGTDVRVVEIGPNSMELCGGTHANSSGMLGSFCVDFESSVSSGVRRIEAFSGKRAHRENRLRQQRLAKVASLLKTAERDVVDRVAKILERQAELERQVRSFGQKAAGEAGGNLVDDAVELDDGTKIITGTLNDVTAGQLREVADDLRSRIDSGAIALASVTNGKAILLIAVTQNLAERLHAGKLMKEVAQVAGSKGGGKADLAQAGGGDPAKIQQAFKKFEELIA